MRKTRWKVEKAPIQCGKLGGNCEKINVLRDSGFNRVWKTSLQRVKTTPLGKSLSTAAKLNHPGASG